MQDRLSFDSGMYLRWFSRSAPHALGLLAGAMLCLWWSQTLAVYGGTLSILTGLMIAAALGAVWAWRSDRQDVEPQTRGWLLLLLGGWTMLLPLIAALPLQLVRVLSVNRLEAPAVELCVSLLAGLVLLALPHYGLARLVPLFPEHRSQASARSAVPGWGTIGAAVLLFSTWLLPQWGVSMVALTAALLAAGWGTARIAAPVGGEFLSAGSRPSAGSPSRGASHLLGLDLLLPLAAGGLLALAGRLASQLWLQGLYCGFAEAAGVMLGLAMQPYWSSAADRSRWIAPGLAASAVAVVLVGLFTPLTSLALWINADVSSLNVIMSLRAACVALLCSPAGWLLATTIAPRPGRDAPAGRVVAVLMFVLGWVLARWIVPAADHLAWCLLGLGWGVAVAGLVRGDAWRPVGRRMRTQYGLALLACAAAPWLVAQYNPGRSARLLFSARVALASRSPADADLLEALDDSRMVRLSHGLESTWTHWKVRGDQLQWRENGYPHGATSLAPALAPESPAELLTAVLPLVVHPQPEHLLVVGAGSGGTLRGALEFPLRSLTCWEQDADALELLEQSCPAAAAAWLDDPRLALARTNPLLASATTPTQPFDVVILNERQPGTWRMLGQRTTEYYARYRDQLSPDGLLCQRYEYIDFGSAPVLDLVRTLSAVFPQVWIWESAPGELLFLATASEQPLLQADLLERFQSHHVRRALGQTGWDCSLPLGFITVRAEDLLTAHPKLGTTATAARAHCEWHWPIETARWAAKAAELQQLLTPQATTALARLEGATEQTAIQQRLADVHEQRHLITQFPDHYWAYRKVLRERLQERPRSMIQQLQHELHPDDERRKDYLTALGAAATAETPTLRQLDAVVKFTEPFDPLVSPFLHREVAQLCSRLATPAPAEELQHWLRSVYFSPGFDRSIRDATAALELLVQHPESIDDPARHWDQLNALLEVLKERWAIRSQQTTLSRFEAADISETIDAAQAALDYLQAHAGEAGIDSEWAALRCRVLDRTLIRALRSHHAQQVLKQQELARRTALREQSNIAPR